MGTLGVRCILLLERDAEIATELVKAIELSGAEVIYAGNGLEALQRLAQFEFDAAVVDGSGGEQDWQVIHDRLLQARVPFCLFAKEAVPLSLAGEPPSVRSIEAAVSWLHALTANRP